MLAFAIARADQLIYSNSLQNGWQNWSWATTSLANTSPVHSAPDSISVTAGAWEALYFHNNAFDPSSFTNVSFWINGGASGGQKLQLQAIFNGSAVGSGIQLAPLSTNAWQHIDAPMSSLLPPGQSQIDGLWIQDRTGTAQPIFYVDDVVLQSGTAPPPQTNATVTVQVDALVNRHPISPLIYGVAFAGSSNELSDLNTPLHRSGGNATTRYNWQLNASSRAADWYFESLASTSSAQGGDGDDFIQQSKNGGAQPMLTIPIIGWVAKLGAGRSGLASYSTNKYGAQTDHDPYWTAAGNGVAQGTGLDITNNDPNDANQIAGTNFQAGWVQHLTNRWNTAANGGLRFYLMDNEWSIWHSTHRDVHPIGATMDEVRDKFCDYAAMVKGIDPNAMVAGPEEWGWSGYFYSGYDQQYGSIHGWGSLPDRIAHTNRDFAPWFLDQARQRSQAAGKRLIDIFSLHYYPQGGEALNDDIAVATQLRRNRSTRSLWDTNYVDESWISDKVMLIPRMKNWVTNYPGTLTAITEYNWGADDFMNGATAQADFLGICGREGLDLATRWTSPASNSPAYNAFKMYRNYDGNRSTFGDTSVRAAVPDPDQLASFAAVRTNDGALTVMVINKDLTNATPVMLQVTNFPALGTAQRWQLTLNTMTHLPDVTFTNNVFSNTVPPQSITLFVIPSTVFRLRAPTNPVAGQFNLWLDGVAGQTYTIQSSTDLVHWVAINTNTLASNSVPMALPMTNRANQFYRGVNGH